MSLHNVIKKWLQDTGSAMGFRSESEYSLPWSSSRIDVVWLVKNYNVNIPLAAFEIVTSDVSSRTLIANFANLTDLTAYYRFVILKPKGEMNLNRAYNILRGYYAMYGLGCAIFEIESEDDLPQLQKNKYHGRWLTYTREEINILEYTRNINGKWKIESCRFIRPLKIRTFSHTGLQQFAKKMLERSYGQFSIPVLHEEFRRDNAMPYVPLELPVIGEEGDVKNKHGYGGMLSLRLFPVGKINSIAPIYDKRRVLPNIY